MAVGDTEDLELVRPRRRPRQVATRRFGLVEDRAASGKSFLAASPFRRDAGSKRHDILGQSLL
jgi:hypothetical protein